MTPTPNSTQRTTTATLNRSGKPIIRTTPKRWRSTTPTPKQKRRSLILTPTPCRPRWTACGASATRWRQRTGSPARMATGGTRRNGHFPECRRIEATGGAECSQLGAETERGGMMAKLEKLYEIIDKENFEPAERLRSGSPCWKKCCRNRLWRSQPQKKMINGMPPCRWFFRCKNSRREVIPCECT